VSLLGLLRGSEDVERYAGDSWDIPWGSPSGGTVNEVTALNLSGVWACETLIADAIATMPVDAFRKTNGVAEEITRPLWFDYPNPDDTKVDYDTQRLLSLLGWGRSTSYLYRTPAGSIGGRRALDPWTVQVRKINGMREFFVDGVHIPARNIQHIDGYKRPGDVVGMSVIQNARAGLNEAQASQDLAQNLYENGLNTSGVVSVPDMPDNVAAERIERIAARIRQWYAGSKNAGKPMVLTGGTTWQPMAVTPADAQFLETRKFQLNEIARWFRVPPHMIGDVEKSTSWGTGIEQQALGFVRFTLMPWIVRLEQADSLLLPRPQYVKYNVNSLIRADLKTRFEAYQMGRMGGWLSANDVRSYEDDKPIPNGNVYLQPLNFAEAGTESDHTDLPGPTDPGDTPDGP
jgi:HK97 family phage portal protein